MHVHSGLVRLRDALDALRSEEVLDVRDESVSELTSHEPTLQRNLAEAHEEDHRRAPIGFSVVINTAPTLRARWTRSCCSYRPSSFLASRSSTRTSASAEGSCLCPSCSRRASPGATLPSPSPSRSRSRPRHPP